MSKTYFEKVVEATGKNFSIKQSISGYYRLMLDDEPYFDDSAADEVNEDYETAEAFFIAILIENEVPENKKKMLFSGKFRTIPAVSSRRSKTMTEPSAMRI